MSWEEALWVQEGGGVEVAEVSHFSERCYKSSRKWFVAQSSLDISKLTSDETQLAFWKARPGS